MKRKKIHRPRWKRIALQAKKKLAAKKRELKDSSRGMAVEERLKMAPEKIGPAERRKTQALEEAYSSGRSDERRERFEAIARVKKEYTELASKSVQRLANAHQQFVAILLAGIDKEMP